MKKEFDKDACAQSYVIINYLLQTGEIVVPEDLMNSLEMNKNIDYKFSINDLNNIDLLPDTEKILTRVYMESIVTSEEREQINELVSKLKEIIKNEPLEEKQENLTPLNLMELKWSEKFKITLKKLLYLINPANGFSTKKEKSNQQNY